MRGAGICVGGCATRKGALSLTKNDRGLGGRQAGGGVQLHTGASRTGDKHKDHGGGSSSARTRGAGSAETGESR